MHERVRVNAFNCTGERKRSRYLPSTSFRGGQAKNRPQTFAPGKQTVAHRPVKGGRLRIRRRQVPIERAVNPLLASKEVGFELHVRKMDAGIAGFLILDNPIPRRVSSSFGIRLLKLLTATSSPCPKFWADGVSSSLEEYMNSPLLYRSRGRWMFWTAFVCAIRIHLGAVVLAKNKLEITKVERFSPPESDVEVIDAEPNPISPEDPVEPPVVEQIPPDQEIFSEENLKKPKLRAGKKVRPTSPVRGATASLRWVKAMVTYAPRPIYPYQARRLRIMGSGKALLTVGSASGNVTDVFMLLSCGNVILDMATLDALRRWRFKPRTVVRVQVPLTYTLMRVSY